MASSNMPLCYTCTTNAVLSAAPSVNTPDHDDDKCQSFPSPA